MACITLCTDFVATQQDFLEVASIERWLGMGLAGPESTLIAMWTSCRVLQCRGKWCWASDHVGCLMKCTTCALTEELLLTLTRVSGSDECIYVYITPDGLRFLCFQWTLMWRRKYISRRNPSRREGWVPSPTPRGILIQIESRP